LRDAILDSAEDSLSEAGAGVARVVPPGSVLVSCIGNLGKTALNTVPVACNQQINAILPNLSVALSEYIFYQVRSNYFRDQLHALSSGTTISIVNKSKFNTIKIVTPPLSEQRRVVAILDEAFVGLDAMRTNAEKNLHNARYLLDEYLNKMFDRDAAGWQQRPIARITAKIGSGATPKGGQESYKSDGIPLIRSMNVHDRLFKYDGLAFIDNEQAKKLDTVSVENGDVLLNITGASVARCCRAPIDVIPARVNQHVSIIRPIQSIVLSRFMEYALTARINKDRLLSVGEKGGTTRQAITKAEIQQFLLSYPQIEIQRQLIARIDSLSEDTSRLASLYIRKLALIAELKQSLLQKAFSGQLTASKSLAA
jgi:type I restriction enzyme S subunit